jgi:anti-sigma regulatory factor (Ser/Thr protein kinase)
LDDLKVAVTEACSNAIDAHRAAHGAGPVQIRCDLSEDGVSVEIVDRGAGFDPDRVATLPAATPTNGGTRVRLTVHRPEAG